MIFIFNFIENILNLCINFGFIFIFVISNFNINFGDFLLFYFWFLFFRGKKNFKRNVFKIKVNFIDFD